MSKQERQLSKEILERIEGRHYESGDKVLEASITYSKENYRSRPRGYYLHLQTYLETATSKVVALSFGDEGDQSEYVLIRETKAFSQKKFDALTVAPESLALYVNDMKVEYFRRRNAKAELVG